MNDSISKKDQAVALNYDKSPGNAPRVIASGQGEVARKIIASARLAGIDIVEDADLLEVLGKVPIGQEIPAHLFQAVAEILAFVYQANNTYAAFQTSVEPDSTI